MKCLKESAYNCRRSRAKLNAQLQTMIKTSAKFAEDKHKRVGGVRAQVIPLVLNLEKWMLKM